MLISEIAHFGHAGMIMRDNARGGITDEYYHVDFPLEVRMCINLYA